MHFYAEFLHFPAKIKQELVMQVDYILAIIYIQPYQKERCYFAGKFVDFLQEFSIVDGIMATIACKQLSITLTK